MMANRPKLNTFEDNNTTDNKLTIGGTMDITGTWEIDGTEITATPEQLNNLEGGDSATGIIALAAGGQTGATALAAEFNNVTTVASAFDSVKLPSCSSGARYVVKNSGASILSVFPFLADSINALAVNLSVDIPVGGEMTFRGISDVIWETVESFYSSAPTTQSGGLEFKGSDNASNVDVTVTNASHGQATAVTIPDSGLSTSYVAQSTAALTAAEVDILDTASAGVVVASKAVVYDAAGKIAVSSADVAATGTVIGDATAMTAEVNVISGADGSAGVILPIATVDAIVTVINSDASNDLLVYPVTASQINALGASAAFTVTAGQTATFVARSTTLWNVAAATDTITGLTATAAELNLNDVSAQTEDLTTGAISVVKKITKLDTTAGAELFTLAAPDASMYGITKVISLAADNGDATLTLTNVQGGSAATTCTWANAGEDLVLVGGLSKWNVVSEGGVVLS